MPQSFEQAREIMVEAQVRPNKVTDETLLQALRSTPREKFLPDALQSRAYADGHIELPQGRCMMDPMIVARLLQEAHVKKNDKALVIGAGTGYVAALLAGMCAQVTGIEQDDKMATDAAALLKKLGFSAVEICRGQVRDGYAKKAPYDVIFINGAVASVPDAIKAQLAPGGRLVTVVSRLWQKNRVGTAVLMTAQGKDISSVNLFEAATPFLPGFEPPKVFVF